MRIGKAVITTAGRGQRALPLQTLVDRDGIEKKALEIIVEEAIQSDVEEVCVVVAPGDQSAYRDAAGPHGPQLHFVEQTEPLGYGHALLQARDFTAGEPFLHMVGDHVYLSHSDKRSAQQLVEVARRESCGITAVQPTRENMLPFYGTLAGRRVVRTNNLYEVDTVMEKPTPSDAEQHLLVPGLRAGYYLCLFGIHVLTPLVMQMLAQKAEELSPGQALSLTPTLAELARRERYLAMEVEGRRFNIGVKYGLLNAQLALALAGNDRETVLAQLVELLANRPA
jgi:UTP--glucose-1-phosphate uridylyltransferase